MDGGSTVFLLSATGQIASGHFPGMNDLYVKHCFVAGSDWAVTAGQEEGISQIARASLDGKQRIVWNFPLDITFRSTSPHGWPQLVVSVFEMDAVGNEVVRGYGAVHLPLSAGAHAARIAVFVPESSSPLQRFLAPLTGKRPEFVDPRVVASGEGRDVTRVTSQGWVQVQFNVITKDLKRLGYESTPQSGIKEVRNHGPSDGIGLVAKTKKEKNVFRAREAEEEADREAAGEVANGPGRDEDHVETVGGAEIGSDD